MLGMAPVAVARQPHHLPGRAVDRQRHAAGEAAVGVVADRARRHRGRRGLAAEQFLGRGFRIVRMFERRQRLRVHGAEVLRGRGAAGGHQQDQASDQQVGQGKVSHVQSHLGEVAPGASFTQAVRQGEAASAPVRLYKSAAVRQINHRCGADPEAPELLCVVFLWLCAAACAALAGLAVGHPRPGGRLHRRQQIDPEHERRGRRPRALSLAGFDRPRRRPAVGRLSARAHGAQWYSRKYDWSPMPHAIFFHQGYAIHGTGYVSRLGQPASHGCVRLHPSHAARTVRPGAKRRHGPHADRGVRIRHGLPRSADNAA